LVKIDKEFKKICEESFRLYKKHWGKWFRLALIYFVPYTLLELFFWENASLARKIVLKYNFKVYHLINSGTILSAVMFFLLFLSALFKSIQAADEGKNWGIRSSYREAYRVFKSYLWVKIMYVVKVGLGTLLLIVPGFMRLIQYSFSGVALLLDGKIGEDAFVWSKKIIQGQLNKYLDYVLFFFIIVFGLFAPPVIFLHTLMKFFLSKYFFILLAGKCLKGCIVLSAGILGAVFYYYLYKNMKATMVPGEQEK